MTDLGRCFVVSFIEIRDPDTNETLVRQSQTTDKVTTPERAKGPLMSEEEVMENEKLWSQTAL